MKNYLKLIVMDEYSVTPKYMQVMNAIIRGVEAGSIEKDDLLPSINDLSYALDISRNTIERAYKELKGIGVLGSVPGKGYFIYNTEIKKPVRIFLLFNKLSHHKKIIYDAFVASLGESATIDFYIYNNDFGLFKKLISEKINDYSKFVIVPHFIEGSEHAHSILNTIPKNKLILMDKLVKGVDGEYGAVYEDFEQDIYGALEALLERLSRYHTLKIIFPEDTYHAKDILTGFYRFCQQYAFNYEVVRVLPDEVPSVGVVYISLMEDDLVELIEKILDTELKVGKDVGVISYNETPVKKMILDGITTISTDFKLMGEQAAELVLQNGTKHIPIPFHVVLRNSL